VSISLSHCFITVRDQDEALAFYRDVLGLRVRSDVPIGSMRWLTVVSPSEPGGVEISLETPAGRPGDGQALSAVVAAGSLTAAIFEVEDCDAIFARAREAGAAVVQEPADRPYGVRDSAVRDPSGNMVRFAQPLGDRGHA
jgi:catechol 2,3-dioxygenase-like lactoylglutathione lyase family enzyme